MNSFCPLLWTQVCTNPTGRLMFCCEDTLESEFAGHREYHAAGGLEAYWNSPYLNWARQQMQAGRPLRECAVCDREEAAGLASKRQHERHRWGRGGPAAIVSLDLKLGNLCNLRCLMCDPNSSSSIAREFRELGWDSNPPFEVGQMGIPVVQACRCNWEWTDDPRLWEDLRRLLPGLRRVKFTGGEPFLLPQLVTFLSEAEAAGRHDLSVQITTNASCLKEPVLTLLRSFDSSIVVSLDGVGAVNDFIRYPSRWEEVSGNLRRLRDAGIPVRINATCSVLTMLYLTDLIEFNHRELRSRLTLITVIRPDIFDPAIAPRSLKERVRERVTQWQRVSAVPDTDYYAEQILRRLSMAPSDAARFRRFAEYCQTLCAHRGLVMADALPDIAEATEEALATPGANGSSG